MSVPGVISRGSMLHFHGFPRLFGVMRALNETRRGDCGRNETRGFMREKTRVLMRMRRLQVLIISLSAS